VPKRIDAQLGEIALRFVIDDWREGR